MAREGSDLKKRVEDLKRQLRREPAKDRVYLDRGAKHTQVRRRRDSSVITTIPDTPSDYRSLANTVASLRRAGVFKDDPNPPDARLITISNDFRHEMLELLTILGWRPGLKGKNAGQAVRLAEIVEEMVEANPNLKSDQFDHKNHKAMAMTINKIVMGKQDNAHVDTYQALVAAKDEAMQRWTNPDIPLPVGPGRVESLAPIEFPTEPHPGGGGDQLVIPAPSEPVADEKYEKVGPLYQQHYENGIPLHVRVLAAILDPEVTRTEAIELSMEVAALRP